LNKDAWAARKGDLLTNKKLTHDEIKSLMERRCSGRRRQRVTDDDIERWVADEDWAGKHRVEMMNAEMEWGRETSPEELQDDSIELGSIPIHRPDGVIRAMMTQLRPQPESSTIAEDCATL
jgi:hypothetical protein